MTFRERMSFSWQHLWRDFWIGLPLRLLAGLLGGAVLFGIVLGLGSLQNGLLWDHLTPQNFNEWGTLALASLAGLFGFYAGVTGGRLSEY